MVDVKLFATENLPYFAYTYYMSEVDPVKAAEAAGFDIALIDHSLALTPEQRANEHQGALDLVWELEQIRNTRNEESE